MSILDPYLNPAVFCLFALAGIIVWIVVHAFFAVKNWNNPESDTIDLILPFFAFMAGGLIGILVYFLLPFALVIVPPVSLIYFLRKKHLTTQKRGE